MKTLADQIRDLENTRAAKMARLDTLTQKSITEGRSFDDAEAEEFDGIDSEIKQIDEDLVRLNRLQKLQAANAQPIELDARIKAVDTKAAKGPTIIVPKADPEDKFEGQSFIRMVIAKTLGKMNDVSPIAVAEARWGKSHPRLVEFMKTDIAGGTSGGWGGELVSQDTYLGDFINFLYGMTVYNKLPLREVPANITIKGQDGAATGYWVGEGKAINVSKADFMDVTLTPLKVAALAVISKELIRDSSPSAEMLVRDSLAEACAQRIDTTFISATGASAGVPAGILHNIAATLSAGTDGEAVRNDIKEMLYRFITAKNSGGLYHVMNPALASSLSLMRNALDQTEFPGLTEAGGNLLGRPVVTGDNVNPHHFITLKPSDIYRIGMSSLEISTSEHATIEMADNPAQNLDPTSPTQKTANMFQTESMAIKAVMPINFARRRESAVAWIADADYGGAIST